MTVVTQQDVKKALKAFEPIFREVVLFAWEEWWELPGRYRFNQRTRACLIHNFMMLNATSRLTGRKGAHIFEQHETALFLINGSVLVRLKKGNEKGLSSNIPTQAALAFTDPQEELFEFPDVARIDICYVLNNLQTQVKDILVVARDGSEVSWAYSIYASAEGAATVISFPTPPSNPPAPDSGMRIAGELDKNKKNEAAEE